MKLIIYLLISVLTIKKAIGQDSVYIKREFWNNKPESRADSIWNSIPNTIFISFDEGFDDSLYITVNDKVIFNGYLKTNYSIDYAGGLGIHFKDSSEVKNLKLHFVNANFYIQEKLKFTYKSLQIRGLNPWTLIYTNQFPVRE
jgi:hypothetical protein